MLVLGNGLQGVDPSLLILLQSLKLSLKHRRCPGYRELQANGRLVGLPLQFWVPLFLDFAWVGAVVLVEALVVIEERLASGLIGSGRTKSLDGTLGMHSVGRTRLPLQASRLPAYGQQAWRRAHSRRCWRGVLA